MESLDKFRNYYNFGNSWPVPSLHLQHYIAYLSRTGISAATATTYLSGISHAHKIRNLFDHSKSFLVSKMIEGMRRRCKSHDLRTPISINVLKTLISSLYSVCTSSYEAVLFASAFSLAFFALLRVGEITSVSKRESGRHALKLKDIVLNSIKGCEELQVRIASSKTDQLGKSVTLILGEQDDVSICPIRLMKSFLLVRGSVNRDSQLHIHFDSTPLTRYQFCAVLKKALAFCGEDMAGCHYRSHSFRIGGATEAAKKGVPEDAIKQWGRWTSNAFGSYIRLNI